LRKPSLDSRKIKHFALLNCGTKGNRSDELGLGATPGSIAEFSKLIADDTEKWAKVVKFAGIKAD
jgi:hypothetical protein